MSSELTSDAPGVRTELRVFYDRLRALESEGASPDGDTKLERIRCCFALASEDESWHRKGTQLLRQVQSGPSDPDAIVYEAYRRAFRLMEAQYLLWPIDKWRRVQEMLPRIDEWVRRHPESLEIRFLRAALFHRLPPMFGRHVQARAEFRHITRALLEQEHLSDRLRDFIARFLLEHQLTKPNETPCVQALLEAA